jgi:RHS repeat-associated protein
VTVLSNGNTYSYDANGNMNYRYVYDDVNHKWNTFNLAYDADNRMVQVSGAVTETFKYNGDGQRIIATQGVTTTVYIGNYFEWHGTPADMVKYYYSGATRVAMRVGANAPVFLMGDHLGSTSVAANYDGTIYINGTRDARQGYKAWGEQRFPDGSSPLPTTFRYTGQRESEGLGLYFYGARWYDAALGRFIQADTIVPLASQGVQAWDRYAYTNNNPVRYNDPSGHDVGCAGQDAIVCYYEQHGIPLAQNPSYNPNPSTSNYLPLPSFPSQNSNTTGAATIGPPPESQPAAPLPLFGPEAIEFLGNAASDGSSILPAIVSGITKGAKAVTGGGHLAEQEC